MRRRLVVCAAHLMRLRGPAQSMLYCRASSIDARASIDVHILLHTSQRNPYVPEDTVGTCEYCLSFVLFAWTAKSRNSSPFPFLSRPAGHVQRTGKHTVRMALNATPDSVESFLRVCVEPAAESTRAPSAEPTAAGLLLHGYVWHSVWCNELATALIFQGKAVLHSIDFFLNSI